MRVSDIEVHLGKPRSQRFLPSFVEPSVHPRRVFKAPTLWETWQCVLTFSCFSHVQLCDPMDCSLPGSSIRGIFKARVLEWMVISSSRWSSWLMVPTCIFCIPDRFFTAKPTGKPIHVQGLSNECGITPTLEEAKIGQWCQAKDNSLCRPNCGTNTQIVILRNTSREKWHLHQTSEWG